MENRQTLEAEKSRRIVSVIGRVTGEEYRVDFGRPALEIVDYEPDRAIYGSKLEVRRGN